MTGIISGQGQKLIAINNMPDHFHILIGQRPNVALSDLVRNIKAGSSGFINDRRWVAGRFSWQEGFGAFSYAHSQLSTVISYIENQQEHHRRKSLSEEYVELLKRFNVPHDQRYIFPTCGSRLVDAAPTELIACSRPVTVKILLLRSVPGPPTTSKLQTQALKALAIDL